MKTRFRLFGIPIAAAFLLAANSSAQGTDDPERMGLFLKAMDEIQERYVDERKAGTDRLLEKAEEGIVASLDSESMILPESVPSGTAEIGLTVGVKDGGAWVLDVVEGSPVERTGIKIGDQLLRIDGENVAGKKRPEIERALQGAAGSAVTLMWADREREYFEAVVKREPVTRGAFRRFGIDGVEVFQVFRLDSAATGEIRRILGDTDDAVIDLRRATGGDVDAALDLAGACFAGSELLAIGTTADPAKSRQYVAEKKGKWLKTRLVVLAGTGTMGAPELLASALKEHRRAVVVGGKTFGSVSRQRDFRLNGRTIRLTVEKFASASKVSLTVTGVGADLPLDEPVAGETVRYLSRRRFPERLADWLVANPPSAFDEASLKAGELKLSRVAAKDKSVSEQRWEFEQSFVVAADALWRELDLNVKPEEVDFERLWLISRTRMALGRKLMKPADALLVQAREDPALALGVDVLRAMVKLEPQ